MKYSEAVLDTNILVSALIGKQDPKPYKVIESMFLGLLDPIYSYEIVEEYYEVLLRKKFNFKRDDIENLINYIMHVGHFVVPERSSIKFIDESDRKFYDAYIENNKINKTYLITGNLKRYPKEKRIISPNEMCELLNNKD